MDRVWRRMTSGGVVEWSIYLLYVELLEEKKRSLL